MDDFEQIMNTVWWLSLAICLIHMINIESSIRRNKATREVVIARSISCLSMATVLLGLDILGCFVAWNVSFLSFVYACQAERKHGP